MPLQYNNYYVDQGSYTQDPSIWANSYQSSSASRDTKTDNFQRYPNVYKMFNNRRSYGETNLGADNVSQQAPVHSHKKGVPRKVRFAEQMEEIGQTKKEADADAVEEKNIDAAADGFINWKRRSLQMCRTFKDE